MSSKLKGIPAAPGLARGSALRWDQRQCQIPKFSPTDLPVKKRLDDARHQTAQQLRDLAVQIAEQVGKA